MKMTVRRPQIFALVFWLIVFTTLLLEEVFRFHWTTSGEYEVSTILIFASSIFFWFLADTRERGIEPSGELKFAVIALSAIAVPYYKFRYFGAKSGFVFLGAVMAILAGVILIVLALDFILIQTAAI